MKNISLILQKIKIKFIIKKGLHRTSVVDMEMELRAPFKLKYFSYYRRIYQST